MLFQLMLETNISEQGAQAAASLREIKGAASDAGASVQQMGTQAEQAATKVADAAQKEVSSIQQVNRALETQAEQEARIDKLIADMQARRAARTPLEPSQMPSVSGGEPTAVAADWSQPLTSVAQETEQVTQANTRLSGSYRTMRVDLLAFSAAAELSLSMVQDSLGKNAEAAQAARLAIDGMRVGMAMLMVASTGAGAAMVAVTGGLALLGAAIPIVIAALDQMREAEARNITANNDYLRNLYALEQEFPVIAKKAQDYAHALADVEIAEKQAADSGGIVNKSLLFLDPNQYIAAQITALIFQQRVKDAQSAAAAEKNALDALVFGVTSGYDEIEHLRSSEEGAKSSSDNLIPAVAGVGSAALTASGQIGVLADRTADFGMKADAAALASRNLDGELNMAGLHYTEASRANEAGAIAAAQWNLQMDKLKEKLNQGGEEASTWASKAQAAAEKVRSAFQGLVEKALTPTEAKPGPDTWDEFRKRAEAVATGTDPNQYGEKFAQQIANLQKLGMTAEQAAAAFKDMSLFADPKNLDLVDWGPVVADINHQVDMIIGRANLMKEGFDKAWAAMDPAKRAQFARALDVDPNSANAAQKVFDAMSGDSAQKAANTTGEMAQNIAVIEGTHTSILDFQWDKAKKGIDEAEQYVKDHILKYADLFIEITAHTTVLPDSTTSGASGGSTGVHGFASGFAGMVGPSYGGPNYFVAGEGGENELLMVIPESALSFRGSVPNPPRGYGESGGGGNAYHAHVNYLDADALAAALARELGGRMSERDLRTLARRLWEMLSADVRAYDAHAR